MREHFERHGHLWLAGLIIVILAGLLYSNSKVHSATASLSLRPIADGKHMQWIPSIQGPHYTVLNSNTVCDSSISKYVYGLSTGQKDSYLIDLSTIPNGSMITKVGVMHCDAPHGSGGISKIGRFYSLNSKTVDLGEISSLGKYIYDKKTKTTIIDYTLGGTSRTENVIKTATTTLEVGVRIGSRGSSGIRLGQIFATVEYAPGPSTPPPGPGTTTPPLSGKPTAPLSFRAATSSPTTVTLTWEDTSSNEEGFRLYREVIAEPQQPPALLTTLGPNIATYSFKEPASGLYRYGIEAYNATEKSDTVLTLLRILPEFSASPSTIPTAPSSLTATFMEIAGTKTIRLTWEDNSDNEFSFLMERSSNEAFLLANGNAGFNWPSNYEQATDSAFPGAGTYYYRIKAYNHNGHSAYSNVVKVIVP